MFIWFLTACYVTDAELTEALDRDGDGFLPVQAGGDDCDEGRADVHPGAAEVCGDGIDNNCDGVPDDDGVGSRIWYLDEDGDNVGVEEETVMACTRPEGFAPISGDCDDSNTEFRPGANDEDCDGLDQDCDGIPDDEIPLVVRFRDADGDGFGTENETTVSCLEVSGFVIVSGDCDDTDASISPAAEDFCDGIDQDCDGVVDDDAVFVPIFPDLDGDGFGVLNGTDFDCILPIGYAAQAGDCNDDDGSVNPLAADLCDGVDQDCDGLADDDSPVISYFQDLDGDGAGNPSIGVDSCAPVPGFSSTSGDCDDNDPTFSPLLEDLCDGLDNDCDLIVDEDAVRTLYFEDADMDGAGNPAVVTEACAPPQGFVLGSQDCDDADATVRPGALDSCDGIDQDCDGNIDEGATFTPFYLDNDEDGLGDLSNVISTCNGAPPGYVAAGGDCDDDDSSVLIRSWYLDSDSDGVGEGEAVGSCIAPPGRVADNGDCDDEDPDRFPGNIEVCNTEVDEDCDDTTDCRWPLVVNIDTEADEVVPLPPNAANAFLVGDIVGDENDDWVFRDNLGHVGFVSGESPIQLDQPEGGLRDCGGIGQVDLSGDGKLDLICRVDNGVEVYLGGATLAPTPTMVLTGDMTGVAGVGTSTLGSGLWVSTETGGLYFKQYEAGVSSLSQSEIHLDMPGLFPRIVPRCEGTPYPCVLVAQESAAYAFRDLQPGVYDESGAFWSRQATIPDAFLVDILFRDPIVEPPGFGFLLGEFNSSFTEFDFEFFAGPLGPNAPQVFVDNERLPNGFEVPDGDLDADGLGDYVNTGPDGITEIFYGRGDVRSVVPDGFILEEPKLIGAFDPQDFGIPRIADWNNDGRSDFVLFDVAEGLIYVKYGEGI